MNAIKYLHSFRSLILLFFTLTALQIAFAKEINLYETPQTDAKVVGTVDLSIGVIPIISSQDGAWLKAGDPRNGNVGWIKSSDIASVASPNSFTYTQRIVTDSNGVPHSYQIMQIGNPQINNQPAQQNVQNVQNMQNQQMNSQQFIQSTIQNMVNGLNNLYQQQKNLVPNGTVPTTMPIMIVPPKPSQPNPAPATNK